MTTTTSRRSTPDRVPDDHAEAQTVPRRSLLRRIAAGLLLMPIVRPAAAQEASPPQPPRKVVLFDQVRADFRFALVVPNSWDAGMPKAGILPFAHDPQVDWFGVIRAPGDKILGEVRYLVRKPEVDARGVFIDLAARRYHMDLREARLISGDAQRGEYLFSYVGEAERNGLEHLWIGEKLAVSLFYVAPGDLPDAERTPIVESIRDSDIRFE